MEAYGLSHTVPKWVAANQFPRAEATLARARKIFESIGERTGLGTVELHAAQLLAAQDRWSDADGRFDAALRIARESGNRFQEAWVQFAQGQMRKRQGRAAEARGLFLAAKRIFSDLGSEARVARCDEELRDLTGL